jgi:hypothetical protein
MYLQELAASSALQFALTYTHGSGSIPDGVVYYEIHIFTFTYT